MQNGSRNAKLEHFTVLDRNKNGFLSQEDWTLWVDNLKKIIMMKPDEEKKLRDIHVKFASLLGATGPGVQVKQDVRLCEGSGKVCQIRLKLRNSLKK